MPTNKVCESVFAEPGRHTDRQDSEESWTALLRLQQPAAAAPQTEEAGRTAAKNKNCKIALQS